MFYQLNKGEDYDTNGTNLKNWLNTYKTNLTDITLEDNGDATITNLTNLCYQFRNLQSVDFTNFNTSNVTQCYRMFEQCTNLTNVINLNLPNCNNFRAAFSNCPNLTTFPVEPREFKSNTIYRFVYSIGTNINSDVEDINVNNCDFTNAFERSGIVNIKNCIISNSNVQYLFTNTRSLKTVENLKLYNCQNTNNLFLNCFNLTNISDLSINASNTISMVNAFRFCNNLSTSSYENIANFLPSALNTSNMYLTNMGLNINNFSQNSKDILANKYYAEAIVSIINISNVSSYWNINADSGWTNISKGTNYDVSGTVLKSNIPNSSAVVNIYVEDVGNEGTLYVADNLFSNKEYLKNIDISNLKTEYVLSTRSMFITCYNLVNISNFNTSNVINMSAMFYYCNNLTSVPNFNTSKVTDMFNMFIYCKNLVTIPNFNTSNVTNMSYMFHFCYNLTSVPNFDTSNVTNMSYMFSSCNNLTNIPQFNTSNVNDMSKIFSYCNNLSNASIQNIINMCINSNITNSSYKNLYTNNAYSPLCDTKFNTMYYANRQNELTAAGWMFEPYEEVGGEIEL